MSGTLRPRHLVLSLGALLLVLVGGCGREPRTGIVLDFWAMGTEGEQVQHLVSRFERAHPNIRVRIQQIPWSAAHEKLLTAFAGDTLPDIFQLGNTWVPEFVALHALRPLESALQRSAVLTAGDFFSGILATNRVDGRLWALPWYVDTRLLYYRSDLLAEAGYTAMPDIWAAWLEALGRLRDQGRGERYAIFLPVRDWTAPVIFAMGLGATLLRDDDRYGAFRAPEFRRAFALWVDLFRSGLAPVRSQSETAGLYRAFGEGRFAMFLSGPWSMRELDRRLPEDLRDAWATAPIPAPAPGRPSVSLAGGASLAVSATTDHADAAWALVEFLLAPEQQLAFYHLTGDLPSHRGAWTRSRLHEDPRAAAFWVQLQHVRPTPRIPEWERIADKIAQYGEATVRGRLDVDEALERLDRDVDVILEKRRWLLDRTRASGGGAR
ncbi:MAG TPA: extracellular solute-binding protein [Chromatiales bacterium]|nr:extracellular solute-binding protein [Chromatiales bacterium]